MSQGRVVIDTIFILHGERYELCVLLGGRGKRKVDLFLQQSLKGGRVAISKDRAFGLGICHYGKEVKALFQGTFGHF